MNGKLVSLIFIILTGLIMTYFSLKNEVPLRYARFYLFGFIVGVVSELLKRW